MRTSSPPAPAPLRPTRNRLIHAAGALLLAMFCVLPLAEAQADSRSIRLLLDYSQNGELLAGALQRPVFEQEFLATGYSNRRLAPDDLRPWDVVVTAFAAPVDGNTITAYKQLLARGGGLVVLPTAMSSQNCSAELRKIEATASCDEGVYRSGPGYIRAFSANFIAVGGNPTQAFTQFRQAVAEAGVNHAGDRGLPVSAYYNNDVVLTDSGGRLDLLVDSARASEYQTSDQSSMLAALDRMTAFAGFSVPSKIRYESKPCALSFGVFVWGASNMVDRLCGARVPGQLTGIFAHEAAHIFQREFNLRYFDMPGFGEGVFQEAGIGGDFSLATRELPADPRSIYLWYMLIRDQGAARMQTLFASLAGYDRTLMPGVEYWNTLYASVQGGREQGSLYLSRAQNVIAYFFGKAFGRNYTQPAVGWGFAGTEDWQPIDAAITAAQACSDQLGQPSATRSALRSARQRLYEGNFELAGGLARSVGALCTGGYSAADVADAVSAASYVGPVFAAESFIAVFGQGFSALRLRRRRRRIRSAA